MLRTLYEPITCTHAPTTYCACGERIYYSPKNTAICEECGTPMCSHCVVTRACETCDTACYNECITLCGHCGARLCPTCKNGESLPECAKCGATLCGWCVDKCDECGTPMCSECCGNGCEAHTTTTVKETA